MWEKIRAYLTFTRKERLGVLVLLAIIVLLFIVPYFFQPEIGSRDTQAYEKYKEGIIKFQSTEPGGSGEKKELPAHYPDQLNPSIGQKQDAPEKDIPSGKPENGAALFYFDPNRISGEDWHRLGLPDRLILTIEHYIQKGGSFRTASDLKKLYGLRAADYERLCPYVRIREPPSTLREQHGIKNNTPTSGDLYSGIKDNHPSSYFKKKPEDLDINQADSADWCRLPGIGIKLASRIVHFRERLGGFYDVDQLRETFGLPDSTFQLIRPYMHIGSTELQKINLNDANQETLQMHPYIRWKLAKGIIQYREQHGGFKSVAELQQLAQVDPENFKKLEPYLEVK